MTRILIVSHARGCRRWQHELLERLAHAGHIVSTQHQPTKAATVFGLDQVLDVEGRRFGSCLASYADPLPIIDAGPVDLVVDLTDDVAVHGKPTLTLEFGGLKSFPAGIAEMLMTASSQEIAVRLYGAVIARARPMISDRLWLSRACNDLLAGAISLIVHAAARFQNGDIRPIVDSASSPLSQAQFWTGYPIFLAKGLLERVVQKVRRGRRPFYWQVAYRIIDGPGIAETGRLDGDTFTVLADDGERFYADPFIIEQNGRIYLFVEEFRYATGRGVISVATLKSDGSFDKPRIILQEPHHLSYPQVFARDGEIYMIPESASSREVVLYRAAQFPDQWERDTVLIKDKDINDATLLEHDGCFWLLGTERFGYGSASDTMVAYCAPALRGPWVGHSLNPFVIDRSAARPGGAFIRGNNGWLLPMQDGAISYGGGLGLALLERLDGDGIRFGPRKPISPGPAWSRNGIHTLNRIGRVEVVDSAG